MANGFSLGDAAGIVTGGATVGTGIFAFVRWMRRRAKRRRRFEELVLERLETLEGQWAKEKDFRRQTIGSQIIQNEVLGVLLDNAVRSCDDEYDREKFGRVRESVDSSKTRMNKYLEDLA